LTTGGVKLFALRHSRWVIPPAERRFSIRRPYFFIAVFIFSIGILVSRVLVPKAQTSETAEVPCCGTANEIAPPANLPIVPIPRAQGYVANYPELTSRLKILFRTWKALPSNEMSTKAPTIRRHVDAALTNYMAARLGELQPSERSSIIQKEIERALKGAVWESVYGLSGESIDENGKSSRPPFTHVACGAGSEADLCMAVFAIGYGNVFSVSIHGFTKAADTYSSVGASGSELNGSIPQAKILPSVHSGEIRFLAWGLHIGSPEGLSTVVLYRFDGKRLQQLWRKDSVPAAEISFRDNQIVVYSYHRMAGKTRWPSRREYYRQVPKGLELVRVERGWVS
jgi:hypothetical protein